MTCTTPLQPLLTHGGAERRRFNTKRPRFIAFALSAALTSLIIPQGSVALAATTKTHSSSASPSVLTVDGGEQGTVTDNFNPFLFSSAGNFLALTTMIYEPLVQYDIANYSVSYPWLATSATWSNNDKTLTIDLRHGVHWSDGVLFTSKDVVFTFDLLKKYPAINGYGITFTSVDPAGPYTVIMHFAKPSYTDYYYILGETYMVPEHIWGHVNPLRYADTNPVGTGPYMLSSYSNEMVTLVKNPHYWQPGKPHIDELKFPIYTSLPPLTSAFAAGQVPWTGQFYPGEQKIWGDRSKNNVTWNLPNYDDNLLPNFAKYPLNLLALRKAISLTINRQQVARLGEEDQLEPIRTETDVVLPAQRSYIDPAYAHDSFSVNATHVSEAMTLLKRAGFTLHNGTLMSPKGTPVQFSIIEPSAYSDFMADAQIVSGELKAIGVHVTVQGLSVDTWQTDLNNGKFDLSIDYDSSGPTPYFDYNSVLNFDLSAPIGKTATEDYERWDNRQTQAALAKYVGATTNMARQTALDVLEGVMVRDLPVIPLVYGASWAQYSTKDYVGFPSPSNPYDSASPSGQSEEVVVLRLHAR